MPFVNAVLFFLIMGGVRFVSLGMKKDLLCLYRTA
jgi:hypothetical protein